MKSTTGLVLAAVGLALFGVACSSKSSPPIAGDDGRGGTKQSGADASSSDASSPDASTCKAISGYEQVTQLDADFLTDDGNVALVIDSNASPMVAWVAFDESATRLNFEAYDSGSCKWSAPVLVDEIGDVSATQDREVTMTRDASDGQLGIAYQVIDASYNRTLMLAQSGDNGATWSKEIVAQNPPGDTGKGVARPTVVMKDGRTYLAYYQIYLYSTFGAYSSNNGGFVVLTRTGSSGPFSSVNVPSVVGASLPGAELFPPSLAIDDNGDAGLAYFALTDDTGSNLQLNYFHTSQDRPVPVFDSLQQPNAVAEVSLVFEGTSPRIAASLERTSTDGGNNDADSNVWFSSSNDGETWTAPVELPMDGSDAMGPDVALAADGKGNLSIATNHGSGSGAHQCGAPKISNSADDGTSWATCGPALGSSGIVEYAGRYVQLAYQPNGKFIAAFAAERDGVWVWRQP